MTTKIRLLHDTVGIPTGAVAVTQSASDNTTKVATTAYVTTALANLADSAPSTLNTLNELAAALGDDANFSTTVTNSIAAKAPLASPTLTGTPKINVGTNKNIIFSGGIGEIGSVPGFQGINDAGSANTDIGMRGTTIRFATGSSERMRIDSAGKVRIGATLGLNHLLNLQTASTSGLAQMEFRNTAAGTQIGMPANTNALSIFTADAERMRINTDGYLLVGKTNTSFTTNGTEIRGGNLGARIIRQNAEPLTLHRQASDGAIINLFKDSASVGSIGTKSGGLYIGSDDAGIFFNHHGSGNLDAILPYDISTSSFYNGHVNLGATGGKFKDLYLGGQVNASTFVFEPTTATGLTYAADGTNSYINFEANSVADSGQLYFGQESSGGYIGIGLKHPSGSISEDIKIHHKSTLFKNRVGLNYPSELMFNGEYTIGQQDVAVEAGHAARIEFLKDDFFRIQGSTSVSAGASVTYTDKLKVNIDAGGILFGSDTAAANTLDDYEEGTWTPACGATLSTASGQYTKIGNQVTVHYHIVSTGGLPGSGGHVIITGLPFTSNSGSLTAAPIYARYYSPNDSTLTSLVQDGESQIRLINTNDTSFDYTVWGELEGGGANNSIYIIGSATYIV